MTIAVAHIGCGYWGRNLARNFAELGVLAAVSDDNAAASARFAGDFSTQARSFEEIIADPAIDAVSIATPAPTHAALACAAIEAGKHVFVEKPLALSVDEALPVIDAADRAGRVLMVGHLLRYHPHFLALRDVVRSGRLGALRYVHSNRIGFGKVRVHENILWSFAPHDLSMIIELIGEEPASISAHGAAFVTPGVADNAICHFKFLSGVSGHVQVSWLHPFKEHRLVVIGKEGMAVFEDSHPEHAKRLAVYPHRVVDEGGVPVAAKADPEYIGVPQGEPLKAECQHFLDCIAQGTVPDTDGREGLRVLRALERAEKSLAQSLLD